MINDPQVAAAVVREAMENLVELIDQAAAATPGSDHAALRREADETVLGLIACLITADGHLHPEERAFLVALVDLGEAPNAELAFLRRYSEQWQRHEKKVPEFFRVAVRCDRAHNTDTAGGVMRELQLIANNCSVADRHFADAELKIFRRYLRLLDDYQVSETGSKTPWLEP